MALRIDRKIKRVGVLAGLFILCGALASWAAWTGRQAPNALKQADKLYAEQSFSAAYSSYEKALKTGVVPPARVDDVNYRLVASLGKMQKWDAALDSAQAFLKSHQNTVWEPRMLYWLGRFYVGIPHNGWRVAGKLHRGNNVPTTSAQAPESVEVSQQDMQNARDALEAARVFFPAYRAANKTQPDEVQLNFDLAHLLNTDPRYPEWAAKKGWAAPTAPEWTIEPGMQYDPSWPVPKKQLFLYRQIQEIAPGSHSAALAQLDKAAWIGQYQRTMRNYAIRWENDKPIPIPYPYQDLSPITELRKLIATYPNDPVRDTATLGIASYFQQDNKLAEALRELQAFLVSRPRSPLADNARAAIAQIKGAELSLNGMGAQLPGRPAPINVSYRNIKSIHFTAYPVRLEDILGKSGVRPADSSSEWLQFTAELGSMAKARRYYGKPVAVWDVKTKDNGTYHGFAERMITPLKQPGAYVVEATAPGVRAANVVIVSDIVLVQKMHGGHVLQFVADAQTGAPVKGANILLKRWWTKARKTYSAITRGVTDANGQLNMAVKTDPNGNSEIATLAWRGSGYAMTGQNGMGYYDSTMFNGLKVYSLTDRSVYRPLQTVHYRELVMRRLNGAVNPVKGRRVKVVISDANGQVVHRQISLSTEFGSVNGAFNLPEGAPLGEYVVNVTTLKANSEEESDTESGSNRFRVEEYKKPEFEVTVLPSADRVRLGEPASAKVAVKYYFGGPVPNAKVTYRIHRNSYVQQYRFPRPFDFLWKSWENGNYDSSYRNGPVIKQGEARTDEHGEAKIEFPTEVPGAQETDYSYTVDADVQDASRRVISGSGTVKATRHDVGVFLNYPRGYASKGDRLDVEVVTLNSSDQPVSVVGTAKVYRMPQNPEAKPVLIHSEPLSTDSQGRAFYKWTAGTAGYFRIACETRDKEAPTPNPSPKNRGGENIVTGYTDVWVNGPELSRGTFLQQGVFMAVKAPYYEEGQTAKVLLVTQKPGCTILLTREANSEILERKLVVVPGRSLELDVPLTRRDVPNVYLSAVMVRDGHLYEAHQELFVPPARQFSTVTVQADHAKYQPGQKAVFQFAARDWQGRPLRTELSVGVTDAALDYIQKGYNPDIRTYFYGDRRTESIQTNASPDTQFQGTVEITRTTPNYELSEGPPLTGMGMLEEYSDRNGGLGVRGMGAGLYYQDYDGRGPQGVPGAMGSGLRTRHAAAMSTAWPSKNAPAFLEDEGANKQPQSVRIASTNKQLPEIYGGAYNPTLDGKKEMYAQGDVVLNYATGKLGVPPEPILRKRFADTAFWTPAVVTDSQGNAKVEVTWPDNLTQWRAKGVGTSATAQVGEGDVSVTTKKDLLVRLEAPRFFVERDQVVLSGVVQNSLADGAQVKVSLDLGGDEAEVASSKVTPDPAIAKQASFGEGLTSREAMMVDVPGASEKRVDWTLHIKKAGPLRVRMTAQSADAADAMEMTMPVIVHGVERMTTAGGVMRGGSGSAAVKIELPGARKPGSSELVVQLNPSMGTVMLDALPYLLDYPYGCVEQTMSRFIPAIVVEKTLRDAGYNLGDLRKRADQLALQKRRDSSKTKFENSPYTYPKGHVGTLFIPSRNNPWDRVNSPVFDKAELHKMIASGFRKIKSMHHSDGGWGWWPDDASDPYMTASVVYGLVLAKQAGYAVEDDLLTPGLDFLAKQSKKETDLHRLAYEMRVLAMARPNQPAERAASLKKLYDARDKLTVYGKALLAMALQQSEQKDRAATVLRNIETTALIDEENGTVTWPEEHRYWWYWYNNRVETGSAILEAYLLVNPKARLVPMVAKWLVNNRRAGSWSSTEETAMAVYAIANYVRANKELSPNYKLSVDFGGRVRRTYSVSKENALLFDNEFVVPDALLETGAQPLTIKKEGTGTLYYTAYTRYFSLEEPIKSVGNEIFVHRKYFRLLPGTAGGTPAPIPMDLARPNPFLTRRYELITVGGETVAAQETEGGPRFERKALAEGEAVTSGDMLEVELQLESKNDYDYVIFEDMKPAGCEPVEVRSGAHGGSGVYSNMELRDQKVAFFLSHMPQGTRLLSYRLRAETPGQFHVLPTNGYAMYAPDIRTLSDERGLTIRDEGK
jgi:uncharacterized protein YfaS (alpha-2-macroglobulin family)